MIDQFERARARCECWLDTRPGGQVALADICSACQHVCKKMYNLHGVSGESGLTYMVGSRCPVLSLFLNGSIKEHQCTTR